MNRVHQGGRAALAWLVLIATLAAPALVASPADAAVATTYTAHTSVNVRAKASTSSAILGQLAEGQTVLAAGAVKGDWLPIKYAGKTAYAWAEYLTINPTPATEITSGPAGKKTVTKKNTSVRATAVPDSEVTATLAKKSVVRVTGLTSGAFTQVNLNDVLQWVPTDRLSKATDTLPDVVARHRTTAKLALRATPSASARNRGTIKKSKIVGATGVHNGGYTQVIYAGRVGWVVTGYLKPVAGTPDALVLPRAAGKRYVAQADAPLRGTPDAAAEPVSTVAFGTLIRITGQTQGDFTQVIWNGAANWIATASLSLAKPVAVAATTTQTTTDLGSDSLNKLEPYAQAAVLEVRASFPQITTIYGWRASSSYSEDHPSGRAIDIMIPAYKTNVALGDTIAAYFIDNGVRLHVSYVIWQQRNYRLSRGYWVAMADRGGDTANHMDHVHVSFEAP
ncbi:MAG TPA: SH3 domain-containing protein [Propionicimonas sp.]|nr:SH3 domain-containing protein [Propionicimonas sp.]